MRIVAGSLFAILLAGCGAAEDPAPPPKPIVRKPMPAPAPVPLRPAPESAGTPAARPEAAALKPVEPPPPSPVPAPPPPLAVAEKGPLPGTEFDPAISTSCFSFRTMDHLKADVYINGHLQSSTTCLWSATPNTAFDPKIPVSTWPPPGAKPCGSGTRRLDDGSVYSTADLWIEGGHYELDDFQATRKRHPHLADGEQILYVRANWAGATRTGALRLRVVGKDGALYRWIDYVAWHSDEDENVSLFKHALWFYALRPD